MYKKQLVNLTSVKRLGSRLTVIAASIGMALAILLPVGVAHAASNTLSLNSSAAKATKDSLFTVRLVLNAQDAIDVVQGYVTYDAAKVAYVPTDQDEYTQPWTADTGATSSGSGYYLASRYRVPPFTTGTSTVVKLTFKALGTSGTADFGITSDNSVALSAGKNLLSGISGTSVALAPAAGPNDPALPGTVIPGTGSAPDRRTDASSEGNNGTSTETAISADEAAKATDKAAKLSKTDTSSATTSTKKDKLPVALIVGIAAVILLALGAAFLARRSKRTSVASAPITPAANTVATPTPSEAPSPAATTPDPTQQITVNTPEAPTEKHDDF